VRLLALARLVTDAEQWAAYRAAVPGASWTMVRLVAPLDLVGTRLVARHLHDVSADVLHQHASRVAGVTATLDSLRLADATVTNDGSRPLREVAEEVIAHWLG
jgi:predicted kinase